MKNSIALALATAALLPLAAPAQQGAPDGKPGGGRPDPEKMRQMFEERFKKADRDGDGALTRAEASEGMPMLARDFDKIDANGDGKVTPDEIRAAMEKRRAEMKDHASKSQPGGPGGPGSPGGRPSPEQMKARADEMFKRADTNGDGVLSVDEAKQASPRLAGEFAAIDADRDGQLTREELARFHEARRAEMQSRRKPPGGDAPK